MPHNNFAWSKEKRAAYARESSVSSFDYTPKENDSDLAKFYKNLEASRLAGRAYQESQRDLDRTFHPEWSRKSENEAAGR